MSPSVGKAIWIFILILTVHNIQCSGTCTFPDELRGMWYSSHKGYLNFTGSEITGYPIQMSATVSELNFNCTEKEGDFYLLKADKYVFTLNSNIRAYICLQILRVSQYKYLYYIGSKLSNINDYVYGVLEGTVISMSDACDRTKPYEAGTFVTLVKEAAATSTDLLRATCPTEFLATYNNLLITDYTGATPCDGNNVNGCYNKTALTYTYQSCASSLVFNAGGSLTCLYHTTSGSLTYLHTWNHDNTVDGTSTFRIVCYALKLSGSAVYATVTPKFCSDTDQNDTYVQTPGIKLVYSSQSDTCVKSVTDYNYARYIFLIVVLILLVIAAVICGIVVYFYLKKSDRTLKEVIFCRQKHQVMSKDDVELHVSGRDFPRIQTAKLRKVI